MEKKVAFFFLISFRFISVCLFLLGLFLSLLYLLSNSTFSITLKNNASYVNQKHSLARSLFITCLLKTGRYYTIPATTKKKSKHIFLVLQAQQKKKRMIKTIAWKILNKIYSFSSSSSSSSSSLYYLYICVGV